MKRIIFTLGMLGAAIILSRPASAATIEIHLTGLDAVYDGLDIYDAGSQLGGSQNPAQSDSLTSITFLLDGTPVGSLSSQIYADFAIVGVGNIPVGGGTVMSGFGGFFDLLTSNLGWGVGLDFNSFQVAYSGGGVSISGAGTASSIVGQALPFGLAIGTPVEVSFLLNSLTNISTNGQFLTSFNGAGAGEITATAVPEPASLLLVGTGVAGLIGRRLRRAARLSAPESV